MIGTGVFALPSALYWLLTKGRGTNWPHLARDVLVSALALVFSFWSLAGSGYQAAYYGVICLFLGVPVYIWMKVGRQEYGETPVIPVALDETSERSEHLGHAAATLAHEPNAVIPRRSAEPAATRTAALALGTSRRMGPARRLC